MIMLSFNCKGLTNPQKKLVLRILVDMHHSKLIMLQETFGDGDIVGKMLESLLKG